MKLDGLNCLRDLIHFRDRDPGPSQKSKPSRISFGDCLKEREVGKAANKQKFERQGRIYCHSLAV
jgi:hypothetical protein